MPDKSVKESAATIRAALKARGWTSTRISVKADAFSMGSAVRVVIKDPTIPASLVASIAETEEHIRRDGSGEILGGGNRYVTVSYSHEAATVAAARYLERVSEAAQKFEGASDTSLIEIPDTIYLLGRGNNGWGFSVWTTGDHGAHRGEFNDLEGVARFVGLEDMGFPEAARQAVRR